MLLLHGTITDNKESILNVLKDLSGYPSIDALRGVDVQIEEADTTLTTTGVSFIIVLSKIGGTPQKISYFKVKRSLIKIEKNIRDVLTIYNALDSVENPQKKLVWHSTVLENTPEDLALISEKIKDLCNYKSLSSHLKNSVTVSVTYRRKVVDKVYFNINVEKDGYSKQIKDFYAEIKPVK